MLFWGLSYIWSKQVFVYLDPGTTVFFRLIISSVFLAFILWISGKFQKIQTKHFKLFLLGALFNPFLYFVGESYGLNLVSPTISAVIIATIPVFTPVVAGIFTKERLDLLSILGLLISFAGVLIMLIEKDFSLAASPAGILLLFGAVASALIYGLILKKTTLLYSSLTIVWGQNTIGILYFLPLALTETNGFTNMDTSGNIWLPLVLLGVFASSLAFVFFTYSVGKIGISRSNIYTNLIPVFAAFFSFTILNEILLPSKITGIIMVAGGVLLSQAPQKNLFLKKINSHETN
jgi:drug/metabolite transporter (DMT)-like permease